METRESSSVVDQAPVLEFDLSHGCVVFCDITLIRVPLLLSRAVPFWGTMEQQRSNRFYRQATSTCTRRGEADKRLDRRSWRNTFTTTR